MSNYVKDADLLMLNLGRTVQRATANLPQTATGNLFAVSGGRVAITSIIGQVTTAVQNQANNAKLVATPTVGSAVDLCAVVDIGTGGLAAASLLAITGLASDAMVKSLGGGIAMQRNSVLVATGNIGLSCSASNTGQVKWTLTYVAYDIGAQVVAV